LIHREIRYVESETRRSFVNWQDKLPANIAAKLAPLINSDRIGCAALVDENGKTSLSVRPRKKLNSEEAEKFNNEVSEAVGGLIDVQVFLPNKCG
jgi:hypothetical protein